MGITSFRDVVGWQQGKELAKVAYPGTDAMPDHERLGLTSRMRRAEGSVCSDVSEGFGRGSPGESLRACRVARGSLFELKSQMELAHDLAMFRVSDASTELLREEDRVLQGLIGSLEGRTDTE